MQQNSHQQDSRHTFVLVFVCLIVTYPRKDLLTYWKCRVKEKGKEKEINPSSGSLPCWPQQPRLNWPKPEPNSPQGGRAPHPAPLLLSSQVPQQSSWDWGQYSNTGCQCRKQWLNSLCCNVDTCSWPPQPHVCVQPDSTGPFPFCAVRLLLPSICTTDDCCQTKPQCLGDHFLFLSTLCECSHLGCVLWAVAVPLGILKGHLCCVLA